MSWKAGLCNSWWAAHSDATATVPQIEPSSHQLPGAEDFPRFSAVSQKPMAVHQFHRVRYIEILFLLTLLFLRKKYTILTKPNMNKMLLDSLQVDKEQKVLEPVRYTRLVQMLNITVICKGWRTMTIWEHITFIR